MTDTITNVKELIGALEMFHPDAKVISREPPFTGIRLVIQEGGNVLITAPEKPYEETVAEYNVDIEWFRKRLAEDPTNVKRRKQLELLEDALIIYMVQRAPVRKIWFIDTQTGLDSEEVAQKKIAKAIKNHKLTIDVGMNHNDRQSWIVENFKNEL